MTRGAENQVTSGGATPAFPPLSNLPTSSSSSSQSHNRQSSTSSSSSISSTDANVRAQSPKILETQTISDVRYAIFSKLPSAIDLLNGEPKPGKAELSFKFLNQFNTALDKIPTIFEQVKGKEREPAPVQKLYEPVPVPASMPLPIAATPTSVTPTKKQSQKEKDIELHNQVYDELDGIKPDDYKKLAAKDALPFFQRILQFSIDAASPTYCQKVEKLNHRTRLKAWLDTITKNELEQARFLNATQAFSKDVHKVLNISDNLKKYAENEAKLMTLLKPLQDYAKYYWMGDPQIANEYKKALPVADGQFTENTENTVNTIIENLSNVRFHIEKSITEISTARHTFTDKSPVNYEKINSLFDSYRTEQKFKDGNNEHVSYAELANKVYTFISLFIELKKQLEMNLLLPKPHEWMKKEIEARRYNALLKINASLVETEASMKKLVNEINLLGYIADKETVPYKTAATGSFGRFSLGKGTLDDWTHPKKVHSPFSTDFKPAL